MKRLACALVVLVSATASAHVRPAYTISIETRDAQHVIAGTTFGLVSTDDGGATWHWTCEQGLHYLDPFDPDYAYATDGAILERVRVGMWLKRDLGGDDVEALSIGVSAVEAGPDGSLWATANDGTLYKAASSSAAFQSMPAPATVVQWTSIEVSPADPQRVYLAGFRINGSAKEPVLLVSTNGGANWTPMATTGFPTGSAALLYIAGIGPAADTVYVYSPYEDDNSAAIYASTNAGVSWTKIYSAPDPYAFGLSFLSRASGELVVASRPYGASHSTNGGTSWEPLAGAPHISALAETPDGEVWAGTQPVTQLPPPMNTQLPTIPGDGYLLMHSSDLATWTPSLAMSALLPAACGGGTPVREACVAMRYDIGTAWCCLVSEYGVDPADLDCRGANWCGGQQDAGVGGDMTAPPDPGCCEAGGAQNVPIASILLILLYRGRLRVRSPVRRGQRK
jgi:photosystem II stability/assembly factor-like uncharacterized protein